MKSTPFLLDLEDTPLQNLVVLVLKCLSAQNQNNFLFFYFRLVGGGTIVQVLLTFYFVVRNKLIVNMIEIRFNLIFERKIII